jgi:hypothetical protein
MSDKWKEVARPTTSETHYDRSAHSIEDLLRGLVKEIPQEEWDKLPDDLNDDLDHYLYGTPKQ